MQVATAGVLIFTRSLVSDELPDVVLYLVRPNSSYDGNPLRDDEEVFPQDSLSEGQKHLPPMDATGVVEFFWRNGGKVPEWINMSIERADTAHTFVRLFCCGRFTAGSCLYHTQEGYPPFHVLGPPFPAHWQGRREKTLEELIAEYGKFRLPDPHPWY